MERKMDDHHLSFCAGFLTFILLLLLVVFGSVPAGAAIVVDTSSTWNVRGDIYSINDLSNTYIFLQYDYYNDNSDYIVENYLYDLGSATAWSDTPFSFNIDLPSEVQNIDWYTILGTYGDGSGLSVALYEDTAWNVLEFDTGFDGLFGTSPTEVDLISYLANGNESSVEIFCSAHAGYYYYGEDGYEGWFFAELGQESVLVNFSDPADGGMAFAEASQVPIPAAAWLFGSVMLGAIGVRRKTR